MSRDLAWPREPHMRTVSVRPNVLKRAAELGQPERLADDRRME